MDVIGKKIDFKIPHDQNHVAVALSGGGDSMALAHMVCDWAVNHNVQIHLLTVNHNLRPEAKSEAMQIGLWVKQFPNARHTILTWGYDAKPETAIMERARQARYDLMTEYCHENDIKTLCVGHHTDDNLETFLFRLSKGSGLDGLSGMDEWSDKNGVQIYRPLLCVNHEELIKYCKNNDLEWIEDPSNENQNYARPRLRKALATEGFDTKRFAKTLGRLARAHAALDEIADEAILQLGNSLPSNDNNDNVVLNYQKLKSYPLDIQIRVIQKLIAMVGYVTHTYPPKLERIEDIIETIQPNKSATLHGCILSLSKDGNALEIKRS